MRAGATILVGKPSLVSTRVNFRSRAEIGLFVAASLVSFMASMAFLMTMG
eukprot:COSAG06_NODE_52761_length_304_cov_0.463415_1_plen_49_part_10